MTAMICNTKVLQVSKFSNWFLDSGAMRYMYNDGRKFSVK